MTAADRLAWPEAADSAPLGDGRSASAVHRPTTVDELCDAVRAEAALSGAVYPQGGRTGLDFGLPPARPGAAVDLTGLAEVVDYPHADMTITVRAGMTVAALRTILGEHNQRLQFEVPRADRATIGGALATGVFGPRRFALGRPRDSIIGVSFVTAAGVEVKGGGRVVKNVAGYDFPKLLTGSLGSLGIITQATLTVRPKPAASALIWLAADSPTPLDAHVAALNTSSIRPTAVEMLNPSASRAIGEPLGIKGGSWTLVVGIEGAAAPVAWQVDQFRREVGRDFEVSRDAEADPLWSSLVEFQAEDAPLACSASMRPSRVAAFLAALPPDRWATQAHAGDGVVHMRGLGEWTEGEAATAVDSARAAAVAGGGNLVVARCPTAWKPRLRVWGEPRGDWTLGRKIKAALDPGALMNPGRFAGEG
ncbi:FAD-binding oxidoreductase [Paludisphaera sp.]|uniref:FAD-binding oxidoreductase n=1 Tax=Paludisphaera sp. TaxID=2017432 RepID=UPI00301C9765